MSHKEDIDSSWVAVSHRVIRETWRLGCPFDVLQGLTKLDGPSASSVRPGRPFRHRPGGRPTPTGSEPRGRSSGSVFLELVVLPGPPMGRQRDGWLTSLCGLFNYRKASSVLISLDGLPSTGSPFGKLSSVCCVTFIN